jgi:hypothetical protein
MATIETRKPVLLPGFTYALMPNKHGFVPTWGGISADVIWVGKYEKGKRKRGKCKRKKKGKEKRRKGKEKVTMGSKRVK